MLAPSGGGLILYQAYGNLYAMTGRRRPICLRIRKSQSRGFDEGSSIWMALEEIRVTWGYLEKKRTRLRTSQLYQDYVSSGWRTTSQDTVSPSQIFPRWCNNISRHYWDSGLLQAYDWETALRSPILSTNFLGIFKFSNNQIAKIMGYGYYRIGNVTISSVYYVERLGHNLFSVGQICDSNLENLSIKLCVSIMKMLVSLKKDPWRVLYNRMVLSKDETGPWKTPYELLHDRKPDSFYFILGGYMVHYPTNDREDLGKLKAKADIDFDELTAMDSKQSSSRPSIHEMTPRTLSSRLVPQPYSSTPFVPPTRNDWDTLLQPLFDEYFSPPPYVDHPVPKVDAPEPVVSTGTPSSTSVDQDAPSPSTSQTPHETPSLILPPCAEEADHDIEVAHMDNNPYFGIPIPKPSSKESSS
ncbi:hypothetical protein Tco_0133942 [Tanacetum coccineum]